LIGGTTLFDKNLKRNYSHQYQHYHFNKNYQFNRRDHLSVIGSYIIITRVSTLLAQITDLLYENCSTEEELIEKLIIEFKKNGSVTMIVEHNKNKAKKLRKKISKDFYIPRELREKFDLF
jgi:hypothetical protein